MNDLLAQAQQALALGDKAAAGGLLRELVMQEPRNDAAWEMFADVVAKREQALDCLKRAVAFNPNNQSAQRKLQALLNPAPAVPPVPAPLLLARAAAAAKPAEPVLPVQAPPRSSPAAPATKRCPYCAEEILAAAIVCKHCGRDLVAPTPMAAAASIPKSAASPRPAIPPATRHAPAAIQEAEADPSANPRPGSYVDSNLMPGERVLYRARLTGIVYVRGVSVLLAGLIIAGLALAGMSQQTGGIMTLAFCVGGLFTLAGVIGLIGVFIAIRTTEFGLTNRRLIGKRGFIRRRSLELLLTKVESISVSQSLWGRLLNYGTIVVVGTGGTREPFGFIEDPLKLRQAVQRQIANQ